MKFKKVIPAIMIALCISMVDPVFASAPTPIANTEKTSNDSRSQQLTDRLIEIRNMDKSELSAREKRELRKEVKAIRQERRNGVYLSVGAIIIIILLLILLL